MARSEEQTLPLVQVMHKYANSLKATQDASSILYQTVSSILSISKNLDPSLREMLNDAAEKYRLAMYGED